MRKTKKEKGITLVALIITIVVLLILAAVAITQLIDKSIFENTELATQNHKMSENTEIIILLVNEWNIYKYIPEGKEKIFSDFMISRLEEFEESEIKNITKISDDQIKIELNNGKIIEVTETGIINNNFESEEKYDVIVSTTGCFSQIDNQITISKNETVSLVFETPSVLNINWVICTVEGASYSIKEIENGKFEIILSNATGPVTVDVIYDD